MGAALQLENRENARKPVGQVTLRDAYEEEYIMEIMRFSRKTIRTYRSAGSDAIPPATRFGSRYIYPKKDFADWAKKKGYQFLLEVIHVGQRNPVQT